MNRFLRQLLIFTGVMVMAGNSLAAEPPEAKLTITIHVYNYARIANWTLVRIKKQVAGIFLRAGIELQWMDCISSARNEPDPASWSAEPSPSQLILNIVPQFRARQEGYRDSLFGFAIGYQATVVNERTEEISYSGESAPSQVLGITIAHELGHLLLGPNSHTASGIMSPRWDGKDFRSVQSKTLAFTERQAGQMRQKILQHENLASK